MLITRRRAHAKAETTTDYFEPYAHFARTLRVWFVAYGVGAPVAIFSNEWLTQKLSAAHCLACISWLYFAGIALQILMTMVWRTSMWYQYLAQENPVLKQTRRYKIALWISEQYWFETIPDLVTMILFGWATARAIQAACY